MADPDSFACPLCGAVSHPAIDWDLVQWRAAFRAALAASDANITALLLELRAESGAGKG